MDSVAEIGAEAPDFELANLGGGMLRLTDFRGRLVIINFWSAECHWSQRADEILAAQAQAWGDSVVVLSIASNLNEEKTLIADEAEKRGVSRLLLDDGARVAGLYGAQTTPQFFLIDAAGMLRYAGALDDVTFRQREATQAYLLPAVAAVLSGETPDPEQTPGYGCVIVRHEL